ncbi:MAG: hypothetical protein ABL932_13240, partial [Terricaulis sp.]
MTESKSATEAVVFGAIVSWTPTAPSKLQKVVSKLIFAGDAAEAAKAIGQARAEQLIIDAD